MHKSIHVTGSKGDDYMVTFSDKAGTLKASCSCPAGTFGTLCKHIMAIIEQDAEVQEALHDYGLWQAYENYMNKQMLVEKAKREAIAEKKKLQRILLR